MIRLEASNWSDQPVVEFDEYVPITATWPGYSRLSTTPTYVRALEQHRLLELKFDPTGGNLVELVLVNVPRARLVDEAFPASVTEAQVAPRWTGGSDGAEMTHLDVTFFQDCAVMTFSTDPISEWRGHGNVFFGALGSGDVGAVGVRWGSAENRRSAIG